jgi:hypothetical protein
MALLILRLSLFSWRTLSKKHDHFFAKRVVARVARRVSSGRSGGHSLCRCGDISPKGGDRGYD